jgi:hypothetical protein
VSRGRIIAGIEKTIEKVLSLMMAMSATTAIALSLAYIAHYDFGLSREEIRTPAVVGAAFIAVLVALAFRQETAQVIEARHWPAGRYFPRKALRRASSTTWSVDKIAPTISDCGAV